MAPGCSICRHQQRALIDVSLLREGTRFTARQFQVSRPSLDRHKKHLSQSVAIADQTREIAASSDESTPLLSQLEVLIQHCERALNHAQSAKNLRGIIRANRELRSYFELKCKLQAEERRNVPLVRDGQQQKHPVSKEQLNIERLDLLSWRTNDSTR